MKKITFVICCALFAAFTMQAQVQPSEAATLSELINSGYELNVNQTQTTPTVITRQTRGATMVFTTRADFQSACNTSLTLEDFAGGPGGVVGCGDVIDENGDGTCYPAGEIQPGIAITMNTPGNGTVYAEAGQFGNADDIVGSNTFVDYTIINFPNDDVTSAGFDMYSLLAGANIEVRLFGNGGLIDTFNVDVTSTGPVFFGFIAAETVVSVELEDLAQVDAELIAQIEYGTCVDNCTTYDAVGLPIDIDGAGTSTADCATAPNDVPVTVADAGVIGGTHQIDNVTLNITHTWTADLDMWLVSPGGVELELSTDNGASGDDFIGTVFQDGGDDITAASAPFTGTFEPEGGTFAAAFAGEDIMGDWILRVCDDAGGDTGTIDSFSLTLCPTNDLCENATEINCDDVVTGNTDLNTDTGGNPAPDQWFSFQGDGDAQIVTLSLCDGGTDYDSLLRVFDACGGTEIASNDDSCGLQSELTFFSDGTSEYLIMVEGFGSSSGNFSLEVTCVDPEPNDMCGDAIDISCGETVSGQTINATIDDLVAPFCDTGVTSPGVWYRYDDTTGLVTDITVTMCNSTFDYDTKLSVYEGDCAGLVCVAGNDDTCGLLSEVSFQSDGNTTYYILVHGFGGATGTFEFEMNCTIVPPPNDMIVNSIDVDEIGFPYTDPGVQMPGATTENGNPTGCNIDGAAGVWYNFVPEGNGQATAEIVTPAGTSSVQFFSAPDENAIETDLELVPGGSNQCVPGTSATINTVAGQAYYVFVVNTGGITDITIDGTNLGTEDQIIQGFTFAPNPVENVLELNSQDVIEGVQIFNILGQKVIDLTIDATRTQVNMAGLQTGTYIMKATVNGQVGSYKVIKQ